MDKGRSKKRHSNGDVHRVPGGQGAPGAQQQGAAAAGQGAGFGGGRGGQVQMVAPGRYQAVLGKLVGDKVTPIGQPQNFLVVQIPQ